MSTPKLVVGGVPEHFNEPWLSAAAETTGEIEFRAFPGGTGAMIEALSKRELDCALLLTEGAVKYCFERPAECALYSVYVESPLVWGIHCAGKSPHTTLEDFAASNATFAISRYGSGSHLMAFVLAKQQHMKHDIQFELVGNLQGAKQLLGGEDAPPNALFLWEKAMTDPVVQQGTFKRVGEVPTPWPCFVLCVRRDVDLHKVDCAWERVMHHSSEFVSRMQDGTTQAEVASKFGIRRELVDEWARDLRFAEKRQPVDVAMVERVRQTLVELGQLSQDITLDASAVVML